MLAQWVHRGFEHHDAAAGVKIFISLKASALQKVVCSCLQLFALSRNAKFRFITFATELRARGMWTASREEDEGLPSSHYVKTFALEHQEEKRREEKRREDRSD